jgi:hypothetical protein
MAKAKTKRTVFDDPPTSIATGNIPTEMTDKEWAELFELRDAAMTLLRERGKTERKGTEGETTIILHNGLMIIFSPRRRPLIYRRKDGAWVIGITPEGSPPTLTVQLASTREVVMYLSWDESDEPTFTLQDYAPGGWRKMLRADTPELSH